MGQTKHIFAEGNEYKLCTIWQKFAEASKSCAPLGTYSQRPPNATPLGKYSFGSLNISREASKNVATNSTAYGRRSSVCAYMFFLQLKQR